MTRFVRCDGASSLRAFCDVRVGGYLLIKGVRLLHGRNGHFISMPRQLSKTGKWYDSIVPLQKEVRVRIYQAILEAFENDSTLTS